MNVHKRFRTDAFQNITPIFNERMFISLGLSNNVLFLDDELNLLPISEKHIKQNLVEQ
jgi:N-acetyltransferase 10